MMKQTRFGPFRLIYDRGDTPRWLWNLGIATLVLYHGGLLVVWIMYVVYGPY
jgi:hypothetical protein